MLFNTDIFLFGFLPISLLGFFLTGRLGRIPCAMWLVFASLAFYSWWDVRFLPILLASIAFNYAASELIGAIRHARLQSALLTAAIAANLLALGYYKYLLSLLTMLGEFGIMHGEMAPIVLPLGISFFTFTQIGYLIDVKQGVAKNRGPLNYVLFVTFFPHLIAGPILHNGEMLPQFADPRTYRLTWDNFTVGSCIFVIGLLKKCVLADPASAVVAAGYAHPGELPFFAAWSTALFYSLQLYFDFSGYSDMAIGLARMFNIRFPLNFNSPYKAASIIDFWQRWHMTLTRYITLYLYNPIALAITRRRLAMGRGVTRKAQATLSGFASMVVVPTMITMGVAGVWHGAGIQFVIFGLLHGSYLCINHFSRVAQGKRATRMLADSGHVHVHVSKVLLTYVAVVVASVFFRAPSIGDALQLLAGMGGLHGLLPTGTSTDIVLVVEQCGWLTVLYAVVWGCPNTQEIMAASAPALGIVKPGRLSWLYWKPTAAWGLVLGAATAIAVLSMGNTTEFLYFQF